MTTGDGRIAGLAERYWRFECDEFPLSALLAGEPTQSTVLFRESAADYDRRFGKAGELLAEVASLDSGILSAQDRATLGLLRRELEAIRNFHQALAHFRPSLYPAGPDFNTVFLAQSTSLADPQAAQCYVERFASVPAFIRDLEANLRTGHRLGIRYPQIVLDRAVATVLAPLRSATEESPWYGPFKRSANTASQAMHRAAESMRGLIERDLRPALAGYAEFLRGELAQGARETLSCTEAPRGREFYELQVRHFTNTDLTPAAVHQLGLEEVARLDAEIEKVTATAGFGDDVAGYRHFLATDPQFILPSREALLEKVARLAKRIDQRIPSFFGRLPRITYGVECMSEALSASMPPAYAQPSPGDHSTAGILWISGLPARCPTFMHVPLALHEGWPGHLMHIGLMQEQEHLPAFRRHGAVKYTACVEGWALYCEGLGVEMGLYETPDQQYGRHNMEMWRAVRLVADTGIHWHGWSREHAIDFVTRHVTLERAALEAEVDRYAALPGQALAYQMGNRAFRALRQRAESALGERFNLRDFHDTLLAAGPVTLPILADLCESWLASAHGT
jgi:uncharacterized protein (DUF885 family)